jgi:hypothetical protein
MPKLTIVPPSEPTEKEKIYLRLKKMPRPDGMIQCNRCGGRTIMNTVNGAFIKNGRKQGGTKCHKDICYHCHMQGIFSPMMPTFKIAKKKK